jgi:hypothetical protein
MTYRRNIFGRELTEEEIKEENRLREEQRRSKRLGTHTIYGQTAEQYASKVGDIWSLIDTIKESIGELQFRHFEVLKVSVGFHWSKNDSGAIMTVKLLTPYKGEYETQHPGEYSRFFVLQARHEAMLSIFNLIEYWKDDLVRDHVDALKQDPLPQANLFGGTDKVKASKTKKTK